MKYYKLEPEVPGIIFNNKSDLISIENKIYVRKPYIIFDRYMGDDLIDISPYFFVSKDLKNLLIKNNITSIFFRKIETNINSMEIYWICSNGIANHDDIYIEMGYIIVSEKVLKLITSLNHKMLSFELYGEE